MRTPEDKEPPGGELIRLGTIETVDLAEARCTVRIGEIETGPIRWAEARSGATRTWSPPTIGEQVILFCPEGEVAAGIAMRGIVSDAFPAPGDSLEELIAYSDGAILAYDPEAHHLTVQLPDGATAEIVAPGGVTIRGDVTIEGDVAVTGRIESTEDMVADGISATQHRHDGVSAGGSLSGGPQ